MKNRTTITFIMALLALLMIGSTAQAEIIFQEHFSNVEDLFKETGVPTTRLVNGQQVADNDWYGAQFGAVPPPPDPAGEMWVTWQTSTMPSACAVLTSNAGILIPISTAGYENVQLSFSYSIYDQYGRLGEQKLDGMYAGYFLGDITGFSDDRTIDIRTKESPYQYPNWEWVYSKGRLTGSLTNITADLLDDTDLMWIGFRGQNAKFATTVKFMVDNIVVTGDLIQPLAPQPVPEPSTVLLLCIGGIGVFLAARKRS